MSTGGKKGDAPARKQQPQKQQSSAAPSQGPSRTVRILVSVVLLLHVAALYLYPLANSRTSFTVRNIVQSPWLRWYGDPLYLNHGHGFFGPDPPDGFLVDYVVYDDQGKEISKGTLPDPKEIWPRLRYHRFKMLADQLESPGRGLKEDRLRAYARQLIRQHDGESAVVTERMHTIVPYEDWIGDEASGWKGKPLDDPSLYQTLLRVTQSRADVDAADAALKSGAESVPIPIGAPEQIGPGGSLQ